MHDVMAWRYLVITYSLSCSL